MKWSGSIRWINNPVQSLELTDFTGFDIKTNKNRACGVKNTFHNELGDCFTYNN